MNFEANIMDLKPSIVAATAACEEIKKSSCFKRLLELILLTGNTLNEGHEKGVFIIYKFIVIILI